MVMSMVCDGVGITDARGRYRLIAGRSGAMDIIVMLSLSVLVAALGVGLGIVLGRYVWPPKSLIGAEALAAAQTEAARREQECKSLRTRADELTAQCGAAIQQAKTSGEEVARLTERVASLTRQIEEQGN